MDCHVPFPCSSRPHHCCQAYPDGRDYQQELCNRRCQPVEDHLRPPAGVSSGMGMEPVVDWREDLVATTQRSRSRCTDQTLLACLEVPQTYCLPVTLNNDGMRFSRHVVDDRRKQLLRPKQMGYRPMQMVHVQDDDPCPSKKGPDCDCFNPDGTWKDKSKTPTKPISKMVPIPVKFGLADDPCPNKKGADCDCFNLDGTWKEKAVNQAPPRPPRLEPCVTRFPRCENNCPECPIEIHSRIVYPKCESLVPGYGGHVPGLNICKFGKTYGRETREALQKVYSTPFVGRRRKNC